MATPMSYQDDREFMCCQCFGGFPLKEATFDLDDNGENIALVLTNVCGECRTGETYWMIRKFASYEES